MRAYIEENHGKECFDKWQSRKSATAYWQMALKTQQKRIAKTINELPLLPQSRILDIGSGPGVLAIPMARQKAFKKLVSNLLEPCEGNYLLRSKAPCMKIWWPAARKK